MLLSSPREHPIPVPTAPSSSADLPPRSGPSATHPRSHRALRFAIKVPSPRPASTSDCTPYSLALWERSSRCLWKNAFQPASQPASVPSGVRFAAWLTTSAEGCRTETVGRWQAYSTRSQSRLGAELAAVVATNGSAGVARSSPENATSSTSSGEPQRRESTNTTSRNEI
jgi:hypothetical protein